MSRISAVGPVRRRTEWIPILAGLAIAGCGQSEEEQAAEEFNEVLEESGVEPSREVSPEEAETWPDKWCDEVEIGMTRDEIREIMGEPVSEYPDQDQWQTFEYSLTAFYNADGTARQLLTNNEAVPCSTRFE